MKNIQAYFRKLKVLCFCGFIFSCSLTSNEENKMIDKTIIKQRMDDFLSEEIGKPFICKDFYSSKSYQTNTNYLNGRYQLQNDPNIEIILSVNDTDNYTAILNPENVIRKYNLLVNTQAISNKTKQISQTYFSPDFIHTHAWTEAQNYEIKIYKKDKINSESLTNYIASLVKIISVINLTVDEVHGHYYEVVLHLFQDEFKIPTYEKRNGYEDYNGPTGDYIIKADISDDNSVKIISRIGFNSKLDYRYKKEIASLYNLDSSNSINHYSTHKDMYPEDVDQNGIRHYVRYSVAIYDNAKKNVIKREYLKVNVFTGEISNFIPKED